MVRRNRVERNVAGIEIENSFDADVYETRRPRTPAASWAFNHPAEPRAAAWDDPTSGTVAERARAWLDIHCAHCHSPGGPARTSGLDLRASQKKPSAYGVCKPPVAAGGGSGGRQYAIVPGAPDESMLVYRLESVEPDVRMPELLRQTVHEESVALVREWIATMEGSCGAN